MWDQRGIFSSPTTIFLKWFMLLYHPTPPTINNDSYPPQHTISLSSSDLAADTARSTVITISTSTSGHWLGSRNHPTMTASRASRSYKSKYAPQLEATTENKLLDCVSGLCFCDWEQILYLILQEAIIQYSEYTLPYICCRLKQAD